MKIEIIPKGKENKLKRKDLMLIANIKDEEIFKKELSELKKNYIVLFDDGYYRPSTEQDYREFMDKCNEKRTEMYELIVLAKKEMEGLNNDNAKSR